jgi:DNA-binding NarL/FixJ family response regulator
MSFCRTLLVDDSSSFLRAAEDFLSTEPGIEVVGRAFSGRDAVALADQLHPDLVIMDLNMPEMNGLEATRLLKVQPNRPRVVILTLHDIPDYRAAAREAGADGFLPKPDFGTKLVPLIRDLVPLPGPDAGAAGESH